MRLETAALQLHPDHPHFAYVVVEQPRGEAMRIRFVPETGEFSRTGDGSLLHARGFTGVYGWIAGTGAPPNAHHDIMVLTSRDSAPGDVIEVRVCGMFQRADGDNKFVAIGTDVESSDAPDLLTLPQELQAETFAVYPVLHEGECWLGGDDARAFLLTNEATHD